MKDRGGITGSPHEPVTVASFRSGRSRAGDLGRRRMAYNPWRRTWRRDVSDDFDETLEQAAPMTFRFDMIQEVVSVDEETRTITFAMSPDPRRYERVDEGDRHGWFDRYDYLFFSDEVMRQFAEQMAGTPVYDQRPEIEDSVEYVESRMAEIGAKLDGLGGQPTFEDKSEAFLRTLETDAMSFVIMSIDLKGSTMLSQSVPVELYASTI